MLALIIALAGVCLVIIQALRENYRLQKKIRILQLALRDERRKK